MTTAVAAMHEKGWVHRDIKPVNFVLHEKRVKLIDFGFAMPITPKKVGVCGTPSKIEPTFASTSFYTKSSDIWSLLVSAAKVTIDAAYNLREGRFAEEEYRKMFEQGPDEIINFW